MSDDKRRAIMRDINQTLDDTDRAYASWFRDVVQRAYDPFYAPACTCPKCGEDVTYWITPCPEPGCPVGEGRGRG